MRPFALLLASGFLLPSTRALAADAPPPPPDGVDIDPDPETSPSAGYHLENPSNIGFGLEAHAGIGAQFTSGENRGHGLIGATLRVRYHYFQAGATYELADAGQSNALGETRLEQWHSFGGFAGVWLPFYHWVDVDASVGLSARDYSNPNPIYGPSGLSEKIPALTFRFGVTDRMAQKLWAARVGAALVLSFDLSHESAPWRRSFLTLGGGLGETDGTTALGGATIALVVSAGFELGGRAQE